MILFIALLFLSGCTVRYDLIVSEDRYNERVVIRENRANRLSTAFEAMTFEESINFFVNNPIAVEFNRVDLDNFFEPDYDIYISSRLWRFNKIGARFSFDFVGREYRNSTIVRACYEVLAVLEDEDRLYLSTTNKNNCFDLFPLLEEIEVNITSRYPIISHNADNFNKRLNRVTWYLNRSDTERPLRLTLDSEEEKFYFWQFIDENLMGIIIGGASITIIGGGLFILKGIAKRNNQV